MVAGNTNILGDYILAGSGDPVVTSASGNTLVVNVQLSEAVGSSSANNAGIASFNSAQFTVDANGYVSTSGTGVSETLTGNSGGAVSPTAGNINTVGTGSITIIGNPGSSTLTTELTGLTNHSLLVGAGTPTVTNLGVATNGQLPIGSTGADPVLGNITSTGGTITVTNGAGTINLDVTASTHVIETITGNTGGAESPLAGNFNILGTGSITVAGSANTETVQLTGLTNHALQVGAGTATLTQLGAGTTGQVLQTNTGADPTWSTATYPSTTTINDVLYSSANNVVGQVTAANNGVFISGTTGIPSWLADGTTGQVLTATTGSPPSWSTITTGVSSVTGTANQILASPTTGAVVLSLIGPYTPATYTAHSVLLGEGTSSIGTVGPTATAGQVLQSAGSSSDPTFSTATYPSTTTINQILYSSSANVVGGITATDSGVLITSAAGVPSIAALTDGQVIIGSSAGAPTAATLTAGAGVTITNGHNSITISSSSAGFTWNDVTTTPTTMAAENGYIADSSSFLTFVLPTNNSLGDTIKVVGKGTGLWTVETNGSSSSYINLGSLSSTPSVGFITSTNAHDCVELVCTTASASSPIWTVVSSMGNITVG